MDTITLRTTWTQALPIMLHIQCSANSEGIDSIGREFKRMAKLADLTCDLLDLMERTLDVLTDLNVDLDEQDEELVACLRIDIDVALTNAGRIGQ